MASLLDTAPIESKVEGVLAALEPAASIVVVGGPEGAGRGHVVRRVSEHLRTLELEAPPLRDADAGVSLLLQVMAHVPVDERDAIFACRDLRSSAHAAAKLAVTASGAEVLTLRLPRSWERLLETRDEDEDEAQLDRVREVLRGIQDWADLRLLVLCGAGRAEWKRWLRSPTFVRLDAAATKLDLLEDESMWGAYVPFSRAVRGACDGAGVTPTPLQTRLLVALASRGLELATAVELVKTSAPAALVPLLGILSKSLTESEEASALRDALNRLLLARRPVKAELLDELTRLPEHHSFFADCVGYGTSEGVRVPEVVKDQLLGSTCSIEEEKPSHERLLAHYKSMDGKANARDVETVEAMRAWLERAHHAALLRDEAEWKQLEPPCPEFYWARARWLSRACKDYAAAASVYFDGVSKFPKDDYGWHYFAWNADRAGRPTAEVDAAFHKAIELDETNRWWNSRYVTFLIRRAQYGRAETEYLDGLARLRSAGNEATLPRAYHRWIIAEWLEQGEVGRARAVFDDIPEEARGDYRVAREAERLLDAEEVEALGVSIYPAGQRIHKRWRLPHGVLPAAVAGTALSQWYPAYVAEVGPETITFFLATEPMPERRVIRRDVTHAEWRAWAGDFEATPSSWIYVGRYGEQTRIRPNPATEDLPAWSSDMVSDISAYLEAWREGGDSDAKEKKPASGRGGPVACPG